MSNDIGRSPADAGSDSRPSDGAASTGVSTPDGASIPNAARRVNQRFAVAEPYFDYLFSPDAGILRIAFHPGSSGGGWWSGDFVDYRGIVTIQMEDTFLRLDAVAGNRCHVRTWRRGFGDRTVAALCRAFLTDLHGAPAPEVGSPAGDSAAGEDAK